MRSDLGNLLKALGRLDEAKVGRIRGRSCKHRFVVALIFETLFVLFIVCVWNTLSGRESVLIVQSKTFPCFNACYFVTRSRDRAKGSFHCELVLKLTLIYLFCEYTVVMLFSAVPVTYYNKYTGLWALRTGTSGEVGLWHGLPITRACYFFLLSVISLKLDFPDR